MEVIEDDNKENILNELYNDKDTGLGASITSLYNLVRSRYLHFSRQNINDFLKKQTAYQLTRKENKPVNRPIVAKYPNNRWAIDLIDMKNYPDKSNKWILTVIDYFTKKGFAKPTKNKEPLTVLNALMDICEENQTYPKILQSDNGGEFKNELWKRWTEENNIKQVFTTTYTPTGNALIENFNGQLWRILHDSFVREGNTKWVDDLHHFVNSKNNRIHSVTRQAPDTIWRPDIDANLNTEKLENVKERLIQKAKRDVRANDTQELDKGDFVRVAISSLSSKIRKVIKEGKQKLVPVKWSTTIYKVHKVNKPRLNQEGMRKNTYILQELVNTGEDYEWKNLMTETRLNDGANKIRQEQRFFATELQKVDKNSKKLITVDTMNRLNKEATNLYDAEEEDQKEELKKEKKKVKAVAAGGGGVVSGGDVEVRRSGREVKKRNILDL